MRTEILAAVVLLGFGGGQRGAIGSIDLSTRNARTGTPVSITVTGTNPCGAVQIDPGDGSEPVTHPITQVPVTLTYTFPRPGTFQVTARGMGNCDGQVAGRITVTGPPIPPPAAAKPATPDPNMRFPEMDRDGDGVITRAEWRGSDRSFREHDWNNDGVLSGDEVRAPRSDTDDRRSRDRSRGSRDDRWPEGSGHAITVDGTRQWTDTGLTVAAGDTLTFAANGEVRLSPTSSDVSGPAGSRSGRRAPGAAFPDRPAGALIARIGNSDPIFIGDRAMIVSAPATGPLLLGVNDDYVGDNRGEYRVRVNVEKR